MSMTQEIDYGTPASKAKKEVTLTIDGVQVTVPEGTSIMRAAMEMGTQIPKLCATDMLDAFGSCRLCLVEIQGRNGTPASCTTPVAEGMVVTTQTDRLKRLRKGVMELYISEHPLDCLTCSANGDCEFQDMAGAVGLREVRYGYGTGQCTLDGILRATNMLIAGRNVVVAGYGWVGKGIASRMAGHGAHVAVVEVDPVRALEALMDGFQVMTAAEAAAWGELFVTATGNLNVFRREHFAAMRDGAIMANSGHFDAELDLAALREMAEGHVREVRDNVQEFDLGGKRVYLIAEGRLVNLGAAEGHPAAVMDMSFANQALSAEYVAEHHAELEDRVYVVPEAIDAEVARLKLAALGSSSTR